MQQLTSLLIYVNENISYYSKFASMLNNVNNGNSLDILKELPLLNKSIMKENYPLFITPKYYNSLRQFLFDVPTQQNEETYDVEGEKVTAETTSGSTGCPFTSIKTETERTLLGKYLWIQRNNIGNVFPDNFINMIHTHRTSGYPFPFEFIRDRKVRAKRELEFLQNSEFSFWHINPNLLLTYDDIMKENEYIFPHLMAIETNGSYITKNELSYYSSLFGCPVIDNYGCREVWNIAYGCRNGNLHLNDKTIIFEIIDDSGKIISSPNIYGNAVITSLVQKSMPFIRYKVGDKVCYDDIQCDCGRTSYVIKIWPGRKMVVDSSLNGNEVFRKVIANLFLGYQISNFHDLNVIEDIPGHFNINIKGNNENPEKLEQAFKETTNKILSHLNSELSFDFTYDNDKVFKDFYVSTYNA